MPVILMSVVAVAVDQSNNTPIVILRDPHERFAIPIWIGLLEASAIQIVLRNVAPPRPMTHDILKTAIEQLGATVVSVEVCDLRQETFFAVVNVDQQGRKIAIDARPSDAIALALRCRVPIFVDDRVVSVAHRPELLERLRREDAHAPTSGDMNPEEEGEAKGSNAEAKLKQIIEQLESGLDPKWKA